MNPEDERLLLAIYKAVEHEQFTAVELITRVAGLAGKEPVNAELRAALGRAHNGKRLGFVLKRLQGARFGELALSSNHNSKRRRWEYRIVKHEGMPDTELLWLAKRQEAKPQISHKAKVQAQARELVKQQKAYAADVRGEVLTTTRVNGDGRVTHTVVLGRDGEPVNAAPAAASEVEKPAKKGGWFPGCGRQPTRAELAARHQQSEGPAYSQPGSDDWFVRACAARNNRG